MNPRASGVGQERSCLLSSELVNQDDAWSSPVWFKRMYTVVSPYVCLRVCLYECTQTCVYACTCVCIRAFVLAKAVLYSEMALRMGGVGHAASVTLRGSRKSQALRMGGGARKLRFRRYVISGWPLIRVCTYRIFEKTSIFIFGLSDFLLYFDGFDYFNHLQLSDMKCKNHESGIGGKRLTGASIWAQLVFLPF